LILRKNIKIVATRCQFLRPKFSKVDFTGGAYSALPDSLAVFKGPASKGRKEKGRKGGRGGRRTPAPAPSNAESWLHH